MSPRLRLTLFVTAGVALGVYIGVEIANEDFGWAAIAALLFCWVIVEHSSDAPPDAWLLAFVVAGYVVGNRGFAQVQPASRIPLLPAEGALLVAVPCLVGRMALKRAVGIRKDFLNIALLVWAVLGFARLPLDMGRYGILALRDFATVYYVAFFFVAQSFGSSAPAARVLRRAFTVAFVLLLPAVIVNELAPDFLVDHFTLNGIPIIFHKSDLIATSLAAGFFWLWTRLGKSGRRVWVLPAAASLLLIGAMASPRAAMAAVAVTTTLWVLTGRWRIAAAEVGIVAAGVALSIAAVLFTGRDIKTSAPYSAYEHAASIFDPAGTGSYINAESGDPGDNNRFRIIWWKSVLEETLDTNPAFGLGFGADLASRFLTEYDLLSDENFSARSPHSMVMTIFGRMGIVGLLAWIAVSAGIWRAVWRLLRSGDPDDMGLASIVSVTWISACVGVVLEGPMGAVVFWTALGLASSRSAFLGSRVVSEAELPVAKHGALDTQPARP